MARMDPDTRERFIQWCDENLHEGSTGVEADAMLEVYTTASDADREWWRVGGWLPLYLVVSRSVSPKLLSYTHDYGPHYVAHIEDPKSGGVYIVGDGMVLGRRNTVCYSCGFGADCSHVALVEALPHGAASVKGNAD